MHILQTDSGDYDLLAASVADVEHVPGLTCELGVRSGGGSQIIMLYSPLDRVHVGVDPWGSLPFTYHDDKPAVVPVYDNAMRRRCHAELYQWAAWEGRDLLLYTLRDTDFFARFSDGVPLYRDSRARLVNQYAFVHFDAEHSTAAVTRQVAFFGPRCPVGAQWVFDDWHSYIIPDVSAWGFVPVGAGEWKSVYRKDT